MSDALRAADERAREAAQTVFDRPLVLTAGAGTGKTGTLVARIVAWCTGPGWERHGSASHTDGSDEEVAARVLQRVLAITFTEAAAAEMADRLTRALRQLEAGELPEGALAHTLPPPDRLRERARALLGSLDQLGVRTIHAWCRKLLAAQPLEAGVHPGFEVDSDDSARAEVAREVVERALRDDWADGRDPVFAELARLGIDPDEIERELARALEAGIPPEALARDPFDRARVDTFRTRLGAAIDALESADRGRLAAAKNVKRGVAVEAALSATRNALRDESSLTALVEALREAFAGSELDTLRDWARARFRVGEHTAIGDEPDGIAAVAATLHHELERALGLDPERLQALRAAIAPLLARAHDRMRQRGAESYDALLRDAAHLLSKPGPAARVRAGLDQVLVDEFQDTDVTQCELLRAVGLSGEPRPGLFLVGDPKQSIYGWRSADLAAYEGFLDSVRDAGGECLELALNFRSAPGVLDEVERVMRPVMRYERDVQPEFAPLVATRPPPAHLEYWVSWPRGADGTPSPGSAAASVELEATAVADDLRRLREEGVALGDVALLFRTRTDFDVYLGALRAADVPYSVEGDRGFYRRREIIDVSALIRAVADPHDTLSLLTWLRSPAVGVPDAALVPLWRHGFPELAAALPRDGTDGIDALIRDAREQLPPDAVGLDRVAHWDRALRDALEALAELRRSFAVDAPDVFVEQLRARTALEATEAARFLGAYRLANLDRFFRELVARLESGERDPQTVLRGLRSSVRIAQEEEEGRSLAPGPEAVNVLTIHKAKGLDFEHVYLLQAHKEPSRRAGSDRFGGCVDGVWEYSLGGAPTLGWADARERAERVVEAERVRTLYVAMTRAKRRLVLAGAWSRKARASHQELLGAREGGTPDLAGLASELAASGEAAREVDGVRWVWPALREQRRGGRATHAADGAHAARARRDAERLRRAADAAALRMRRPFRGAASDAAHATLDDAPGRGAYARDVALRVGTEVHRVLEEFDLSADPAAELERQRALALSRVEPRAAAATGEVLDALARGSLLPRLCALAPAIVARELPVLLPPGPGDDEPDSPTGAIEGVLDLVYVEPGSGRWVVVDFKTDAEVESRIPAYAEQLEVYARALEEGLGLDDPPRRELWFLTADRVVTLEGAP